jgi:hypothetical protein
MMIRCLIQKDGPLFVAMSLEFGLASQANSLSEAKSKLEGQIDEYLSDARHADSEEKRKYLLDRKGPWQWFAVYYVALALSKVHLQASTVVDFMSIHSTNTVKHA